MDFPVSAAGADQGVIRLGGRGADRTDCAGDRVGLGGGLPAAPPASGHRSAAGFHAAAPAGGHTPGGQTALAATEEAALDRVMAEAWREAQRLARELDEFLALVASGYSARQAARALGRSPSWFCGEDSPLARYRRGGVAALLPAGRKPGTAARFEVPDWFIPAARFFYLASNAARARGSVPEAIRRTISLPALPTGWTRAQAERLAAVLGGELPTCPPALREAILAREKAGKPLVPERLARQIALPESLVQRHRSPRAWALDHLSAPGSQRRWRDPVSGRRLIMQPGDWFGGDDATPGIAVCVPCHEVITPCSERFGVLLGRFQWLPFHDCRTDKILGWSYVIRPRGSYRAEDILQTMSAVVRAHGIPRVGFQFEGGVWNARLVREAIDLLGCAHWRTWSPHQKAIESVFNRVWTRLAVQFPHADMGRYRAENEANCALYEACKAGHSDPRACFPPLELVCRVFEEEVAAHNARLIVSEQYGRWVPDEFFARAVGARPLRPFHDELAWIFAPWSVERTVRGMLVRCRVPMFEDFSVPYEFSAEWLPLHSGRRVRLHFDPRQPRCTAKCVLLEAHGDFKAGQVLGDVELIGETAAHIRLMMGWARDDQRAGYIARQRAANFMRRETRGVGLGGRVTWSQSEERDGLGTVTSIQTQSPPSRPDPQPSTPSRAERIARMLDW